MSPLWVVLATTGIIFLSAFFVVIEFSLLGARRNRLEDLAPSSRTARAALRGVNELTIMLAGAQLGITICTFALGAITKPAVDAWLSPLMTSWDIPVQISGATSFALSLLFVTFLHLVIGEMAPKSWAIAHPELAARFISIPARSFVWLFRPLLRWVNNTANRLVAASGFTPAERLAIGGQDTETIRQLVEHSASNGSLQDSYRAQLSGVLDLETLTVGASMPHTVPSSLPETTTVGQVRQLAAQTGHMRILLEQVTGVPKVLHVRDTLLLPDIHPAKPLARSALTVQSSTPLPEALAAIRAANEQLVIVLKENQFHGIITVSDILRHIFPGKQPTE